MHAELVNPLSQPAGATPSPAHSRIAPFAAPLVARRRLSGPGSDKEVYHYEFSLAGSGLSYEPGDSIGIYPRNDPELAGLLICQLGLRGDEEVFDAAGLKLSLFEILRRDCNITRPSRRLVEATLKMSGIEACSSVPGVAENAEFSHGDVLDLLRRHPKAAFAPQEFVNLLSKLPPRLYSAASSLRAHPEMVQLMVATVRYDLAGRKRNGVCSTYLADQVQVSMKVPLFIHVARHFHLPAEGGAPVIMIGAGTGVAPYRAFLQDRAATGARGRNWLIFGERRRHCDFAYQDEWVWLIAKGLLTRMDTAFSRDQAEHLHVQHRMLEHAGDLWRWLEEGAVLYVCGDATHMAGEVDAALVQIVREAGGMSPEAARQYVTELRSSRRYRRDVYA